MSRRRPEITKRLTKLSVPELAVPHVKFLFAEMHRQRLTYEDVEWKSGILKNTLKAWRHKNQPNLANIEACINAVGWTLMPIPSAAALPPAIMSKLAPVAEECGLTMPETIKLLIEILARGSHFTGTIKETTNDRACPRLLCDGTGTSAQCAEASSGNITDAPDDTSRDFALAA